MRSEVTEVNGREAQTSRAASGCKGRSVLGTNTLGQRIPPTTTNTDNSILQLLHKISAGHLLGINDTCKIVLSK